MNATRKHAVAALVTCAAVGTLAAVAMLAVVPALATPPSAATTELIGGPAPVGAIHATAKDTAEKWSVKIKSKGVSDLVVVRVTVAPGGTLGWHRHPGLELPIVQSGTATYYYGDDPTCTLHAVTAVSGVVPLAGGRVHTVRNEGTVPLVIVGTLIVPHGAPVRIDQARPGNCPF